MKKPLKILMIVLGALVLLAAIGMFALDRYVKSPRFQEYVLAKTQEHLAVPVEMQSFDASLFSGFELRGLIVKNPSGSQTPSLLDARVVTLRYRLWPLLRKRVEVETMELDGATVVLEKAGDGTWNYEKLTAARTTEKTADSTKKSEPSGGAPSDMAIEISRLAVANLNLLFLKPENKKLLEITDLDLQSSVSGAGPSLGGRGELTIQRAAVIESLEVIEVQSPVLVEQQQLKLTDLTGQIEDGTLKGNVVVDLAREGSPYTVHVEVSDVDVAKLGARFTDKAKYLSGKLRLTTDLTGTGGDTTALKGAGSAHLDNGTLSGIALMRTLATVLQLPELESIQFDEITIEYLMDKGVIETPVIKVLSKDIQITGSGRTDFDFNLDHKLTLALSTAVEGKLPNEISKAFTKREDGFRTIDFTVTGPYDNPKTDLTERLVKSAAGSLIEKGLNKLLGGEKEKSGKEKDKAE